MGRLTDSAKERITSDPLRKYKKSQTAPNWLSGAGIWAGIAAVALGVGFLVFTGATDDGPTEVVVGEEEARPQQEVNPYAEERSEDADENEEPADEPTDDNSAPEGEGGSDNTEILEADFTALDSVSMPVETSSLDSPAPAGAANVARAGAVGMTTGDWSDVPVNRSPNDDRYLGVEVDFESMRLTDPVGSDADADKAFTFLFDGVDSEGTDVQFTVTSKWEDDTYQVVIF